MSDRSTDESTSWKRVRSKNYRYLYGSLLIVSRTKIAGPRRGTPARYEATVDGAPAPAKSEGLHMRASDAKAACEDYVMRSCRSCRRSGFLHDLAGKPYVCDACGGTGADRG